MAPNWVFLATVLAFLTPKISTQLLFDDIFGDGNSCEDSCEATFPQHTYEKVSNNVKIYNQSRLSLFLFFFDVAYFLLLVSESVSSHLVPMRSRPIPFRTQGHTISYPSNYYCI